METNESILMRQVVALNDRKMLGKVKDLCVDYNDGTVSFFIVSSAATSDALVLPFSKSLAVGDAFMTIHDREDFLTSDNATTKATLQNGYRLIGVNVYSRAGNHLGNVASYEFDTTYGTVTKLILNTRATYDKDTFMFFSPDFVFVDDGEKTAADIRTTEIGSVAQIKNEKAKTSEVNSPSNTPVQISNTPDQAAAPKNAEPAKAPLESEPPKDEASKNEESVVPDAAPAAPVAAAPVAPATPAKPEQSNGDAELKEFLIGLVVNDDVSSKNGAFKVEKGTKLTKELVEEAQKHDSLLLLTMSVDA